MSTRPYLTHATRLAPAADDGSPVRLALDAELACRCGCTWRDSPGPSSDTRNNPCRRQGDRVVASGSTGRRLLVEDDPWRLRRDADIEQPDCVGGGVGGPSSCDRARVPGWTSRWGRGRLGHVQDDQETFDPRLPVLRSLRLRLRSSARARTVRSRVVRGSSGTEGDAGACSRADARVRLSFEAR